MNATYVLKRHLSPDQHPNVEDAIRIIHDEVRHANVIITGLLDYARVRTPDRHPASLVELIERVLAADGIPSSVLVERAIEGVPLIEVDADQIHGAFFNLVRNAVEAMPEGGKLRVELRTEDDRILVAVTDSGSGHQPTGARAPLRAAPQHEADGHRSRPGHGAHVHRSARRPHHASRRRRAAPASKSDLPLR